MFFVSGFDITVMSWVFELRFSGPVYKISRGMEQAREIFQGDQLSPLMK